MIKTVSSVTENRSEQRVPVSPTKFIRILLWLLVPVGVWWAFKEISIHDFREVFSQVSISGILILMVINVLIFTLISSRWWLILFAQGFRRSIFSITGYRLAAFGMTYFTPGPQFGGEPLQVYFLKQREKLPSEVAATSVAVDKLLELLANFSFLLVGVMVVLLSDVLNGSIRTELLYIPASLLVLPLSYLAALWLNRRPISWISRILSAQFKSKPRLKTAGETIRIIEDQVAEFCKQNPLALFAATLLSILIWILMVFEFGMMMHFLGLELNLTQIMIALTAARIAFLLPLPAGLGGLEAGQVMAMGLIGVNPVFGLSLSIFIRVRDVIFGGLGLWMGGLLSR